VPAGAPRRNRAGAGGSIGTSVRRKGGADGYTLLIDSNAQRDAVDLREAALRWEKDFVDIVPG